MQTTLKVMPHTPTTVVIPVNLLVCRFCKLVYTVPHNSQPEVTAKLSFAFLLGRRGKVRNRPRSMAVLETFLWLSGLRHLSQFKKTRIELLGKPVLLWHPRAASSWFWTLGVKGIQVTKKNSFKKRKKEKSSLQLLAILIWKTPHFWNLKIQMLSRGN